MYLKERSWLLTAVALPLFLTLGCSADAVKKTAEVSPAAPSGVIGEENPAAAPQAAAAKEQPSAAASPSDRAFVLNDNVQTVYFDLSQSSLNDTAKDAVKKNAEWLAQNPAYMIKVVGTADTRGSTKRNQTLAFKRAAAVRDQYLALGIPKGRILVTSLVQEAPACAPVTEECLAKDRRTDTLIENKDVASR